MANIDLRYKQKYLKYKQKYLKLVGGTIPEPPKMIRIYSFNVLNPSWFITKMLFQNLFEKKDLSDKKNQDYIKNLAYIDEKRFDLYRMNAIVNIIRIWLSEDDNTVITLQEVNLKLLDALKLLMKNEFISENIVHTDESSEIMASTYKGKQTETKKDEYRVTIIGNNLSFNKDEDLEMKVIIDGGYVKKNCLYTQIKVDNKLIDVFNVHFYWKSSKQDLDKFTDTLKMNLHRFIPYIICGDFNKEINNDALTIFNSELNANKEDSIPKGDFTSYDTQSEFNKESEKVNLVIIDHIVIDSTIKYLTKPTILSTVGDYEIFYDLPAISSNKNLLLKLNDKSISDEIKAGLWRDIRFNKDISDHKPVMARIILDQKI